MDTSLTAPEQSINNEQHQQQQQQQPTSSQPPSYDEAMSDSSRCQGTSSSVRNLWHTDMNDVDQEFSQYDDDVPMLMSANAYPSHRSSHGRGCLRKCAFNWKMLAAFAFGVILSTSIWAVVYLMMILHC